MPDDVSSRILAATLAEQAAAKGPIVAATPVGAALLAQNPLIAASGPSHWAVVAELLRITVAEGYVVQELLDLVEQIIRDLGDGQ